GGGWQADGGPNSRSAPGRETGHHRRPVPASASASPSITSNLQPATSTNGALGKKVTGRPGPPSLSAPPRCVSLWLMDRELPSVRIPPAVHPPLATVVASLAGRVTHTEP